MKAFLYLMFLPFVMLAKVAQDLAIHGVLGLWLPTVATYSRIRSVDAVLQEDTFKRVEAITRQHLAERDLHRGAVSLAGVSDGGLCLVEAEGALSVDPLPDTR